MKITQLKLNNFRNYNHENFNFCDNLNIILGDNGSGKTTLLEAIHYLSITKSFRTHNNGDVVQYDNDYFQLFGIFLDSKTRELSVNLNFSKKEGKKLFFNQMELIKKTEIIGKIPVIILSPNNQKITEGGPSLRRSFIDRILSQTSKEYLVELIEFKKRLYQRNILLSEYKEKKLKKYNIYIETIDDFLIKHAYQIQKLRIQFIEEFNPVFMKIFSSLSHTDKPVKINIIPNVGEEIKDFKNEYKEKLVSKFKKDIIYGRTGTGPHLDQPILLFNKRDIRFTGSQGEHKIFLVALKLAEGLFIESNINENVIFLLDDLFALLDKKHSMNIIDQIGFNNQTFITATDMTVLKRSDFNLRKYTHNVLQLPVGLS